MSDTLSPIPSAPQTPEGFSPSSAAPPGPATPRPRLWPGVLIIVLEWLAITVPGWVAPGTFFQFMGMFWSPMIGAAAIALWWLFLSRLSWREQLPVLLAAAMGGVIAWGLYHPSVGAFGLIMYALPTVATVWVLWMLATPFLRLPVRRMGLLVVVLLAWGYFAFLRVEGIDGNFSANIQYRWSPTAEDRYRA